jgi:hypothetical protein
MNQFIYNVLMFLLKNNIKGLVKRRKFENLKSLFSFHFKKEPFHPCRETLYKSLKLCEYKPLTIIETGSSAWGANSSVLFDSYVNSFGGSFDTVDIRTFPMLHLIFKCTSKTNFHCGDSVNFLKELNVNDMNQNLRKFIYLDSFDVDFNDPIPSMEHGLNEFLKIQSHLKSGDIILIDDTPKNYDVLLKVQGIEVAQKFKSDDKIPGKGSLIKDYVIKNNLCEIIDQDYQLLLKFK